MRESVTRRDWLALSALAVGAIAARPMEGAESVSTGPAEPVSVAKVHSYDEDLTTQFRKMFDQARVICCALDKPCTISYSLYYTAFWRFLHIHFTLS